MAKSQNTLAKLLRRERTYRQCITALTFCLSGCSSIHTSGDLASLWEIAKQTVTSDHGVSLKEAAASPYASLGVRVGSGPELMLLLASDNSSTLLWTSAAHIAIMTRHGRVTHTAGLAQNLGGSDLSQVSANSGDLASISWRADFPEIGYYNVQINCWRKNIDRETVVILGANIHADRIEEHCSTQDSKLNWDYVNTYWTDSESGLVWKSIQHVSPHMDPLTLEVLRAPKTKP